MKFDDLPAFGCSQTELTQSAQELKESCGVNTDGTFSSPFGSNTELEGDCHNNQYSSTSKLFNQQSDTEGRYKASQYFAEFKDIQTATEQMIDDFMTGIKNRANDQNVIHEKPQWVRNQVGSTLIEKFAWKAGLCEQALFNDLSDYVISCDSPTKMAQWEKAGIDGKVQFTKTQKDGEYKSLLPKDFAGKAAVQVKTNVDNPQVKAKVQENVDIFAVCNVETDSKQMNYELRFVP